MQTEVTFRDIERSEAVEQRVRERAERLGRLSDRITSCHVVIQAPHRHHHKGMLYDVRIQLHVPGHELVVSREGSDNHAYEDVYVVVRDAFDAAERKLEELQRKLRDH
jgi:ribosomal subunit interface protein